MIMMLPSQVSPGDDPAVLVHPLDHQVEDLLPDRQGEVVEGVGPGLLEDLLVSPRLLGDLVEEELVGLRERRAEALVQDVDDLGEGRDVVLRFSAPDLERAVDRRRFADREVNPSLAVLLQTVVVQGDLSLKVERLTVASAASAASPLHAGLGFAANDVTGTGPTEWPAAEWLWERQSTTPS